MAQLSRALPSIAINWACKMFAQMFATAIADEEDNPLQLIKIDSQKFA